MGTGGRWCRGEQWGEIGTTLIEQHFFKKKKNSKFHMRFTECLLNITCLKTNKTFTVDFCVWLSYHAMLKFISVKRFSVDYFIFSTENMWIVLCHSLGNLTV